ncbi:MAG: recombinase family protein [Rubrivivax sp.]|nr:recombinase family protein [Rubrivivax sp.]
MAAVAFYIRPHPTETAEAQRARLDAWASAEGHEVAAVWLEPERKRGLDHRRRCTEMLREAPKGAWDVLASTSLLTLARSVPHANETLALCEALGIAVVLLDECIDTATDGGATARGFAMCARLDRLLHVERATTGVCKRRDAGLPVGRPKMPATVDARIAALLKAGVIPERITRLVGVGKSTVYRVRDELRAAGGAAA